MIITLEMFLVLNYIIKCHKNVFHGKKRQKAGKIYIKPNVNQGWDSVKNKKAANPFSVYGGYVLCFNESAYSIFCPQTLFL